MLHAVDIVVIVLIVAFALTGLKNGLVKSLVRLIGGVLAVVLAYFLTSSASGLLSDLIQVEGAPLNQFLAATLEQEIAGNFTGAPGVENIFVAVPDGGYTVANVSSSLTLNGIPAFLSNIIAPVLVDMMQGSTTPLATYAAAALSEIIMSAGAFILLFIIISVILGLITKLLDKIFSLPVIGLVNRLGGLLFGAIKAVLFIWIALFLVSVLGVISAPINELIAGTTVVKFLAEHNLLTMLVSGGLDIEKAISDLLSGIDV